jgi:hypothetical protein
MKMFLCLAAVGIFLAAAAVAAEPPHAKVELDLSDPAAAAFLRDHAARLDILQVKPGSFAHIAAQPRHLELLRGSGFPVRILSENMEADQAFRDKGVGYGIYHTWSETVAFVDSLRLLYPAVISEKWSIGTTHEGRDLWAFRVSDNPDVDENEPEILIDAMHHAREIMSSEFTIMFAEYLAQNYGTDPEITWLLDNRELYIVPVVNPDGSVYNETNNPAGGGMWRKNRRDNGDGTSGVDPNRNYPYQWGYDDTGSSPFTDDITYRGPSAGSEPEIQAMMNFVNSREFRTHDTIHSYSNLTLIPWGYTSLPTADDFVFQVIGAEMTKYNGYVAGQPNEAINYPVNGGTFDWTYGDDSQHTRIFSVSNEIGSGADGFWPPESRREPLFLENIWPHIYLMRVAGAFVEASDPVVFAPAKNVSPGQDGLLSFSVANTSVVAPSAGVNLSLRTDDPWVQFQEAVRTVPGLSALAAVDLAGDPIPFTVDAACPDGHFVAFDVTVGMPEGDLIYPMGFVVGTPSELLSDDLESGPGNWTLTGQWGTTTGAAQSPVTSLTDSPAGNYPDQTTTTATLNGTWLATSLSFWHRYDIELDYDYGKVQIAVDGGPWLTLGAFTGTSGWTQETFDLAAYAGNEIAIRFAMESDYSVREDGWYLDDVVVTGLSAGNATLVSPAVVTPTAGTTVAAPVVLTVTAGAKSLVDPAFYGFRIYDDALCSNPVAAVNDVPSGGAQTSWTAPVLPDGDYWWRAWAGDGTERSVLSPPTAFTINGVSGVDQFAGGGPGLRILGNVTGSGTRLELALPTAQDVTVDIYDPRGARVRRLHTGTLGGGTQILVWDGKDSRGRAAASGVYFVQLQAGREILTGKVVIVR